MSELTTAHGIVLDVVLIVVTMLALDFRESRWLRRVRATERDARP